jgi:hypothetical protein
MLSFPVKVFLLILKGESSKRKLKKDKISAEKDSEESANFKAQA